MQTYFPNIGLIVPEIYLPNESINKEHRSVVACDQYTSQPEYRKSVEQIIGNDPSTYHITFPEIFLEDENKQQRIENIQNHMTQYMEQGVIVNHGQCFMIVDRATSHTTSRKWLIVWLDLEHYDFNKGSQTLIRATEGTVLDRLPPRIEIRKNALLELPHIMVLIDDPQKTVIEPLFAKKDTYQKVYDTDLMMQWWHIKWYKVTDEESINNVATMLSKLADKEMFSQKYQVPQSSGVLLFAMGDGNHSLATAKAIREEKKQTLTPEQQQNHPARFALVELVNIHDEGLVFEPIHRVLFDVQPERMIEDMKTFFTQQWSTTYIETYTNKEDMKKNQQQSDSHHHRFSAMYEGTYLNITIENPVLTLEVGNLQAFLDNYVTQHPESKIDYIHGEEVTESLGTKKGNIWFVLPIMDKKDFFTTVIVDGALPRKTFSMGEAEEKRYYLECRKIKE